MNHTNVSSPTQNPRLAVLDRVSATLPEMSRQLRKAAEYVLDNPNEVGLASIREVAAAAGVKPNSLVRMARAAGFDGYEDFRRPFREMLRNGREDFPDRARWLQSLARGGRHGSLYRDMAAATIENVEQLYGGATAVEVKAVADLIVAANNTYVLGVGVFHAIAHEFAYLGRMAFDNVTAVPRDGGPPVADLTRAGPGDVLLAMSVSPYRTEVVEAVRCAERQGATVVALTDARSSPIALGAACLFLVPTDTPQFFTSVVAMAALLETIMAFVVADADRRVIENIEREHRRRHELGIYWRAEA
jgi:DNA-binding MurR/RpiR family transcriptional regulator